MSVEWDAYRAARAEAYLLHVAGLRARMEAARLEAEAARAEADMLAATDPSRRSGMPDRGDDAMADAVCRMSERAAAAALAVCEYDAERAEAHEAVMSLPDPRLSLVLSAHYLHGLTWSDTAKRAGYSLSGAMALRKRALSELYDRMPHRWRDPRHPAL